MSQILSLTKWFSIQISIIHDINSSKNIRIYRKYHTRNIGMIVLVNLIIRSVIRKVAASDIKYHHMTLNKTFMEYVISLE